ncbi:MAG: glycosyltransferase [Desulfarculaceae bacterium]|nr:glycosyltransferase [Desulfarculaceae bacterium]MCF8045973.1 glycosyltransferase [Desulfarculaceae bacterium]MCF8122451.1 glycosyltransferase [Desulfarculaceae bacterium]
MPPAKSGIKVLQVVWSLEVGGMERVVVHLLRGLPAQGCAAEVVTLGGAGGMAEDLGHGVKHWEMQKAPGLDLKLARGLARLVRTTGADVMHAHNTVSQLYAVMASLITRCPVVVTLHGANYEGSARHRRLRRLLAARCAATACVSRDAMAAARDLDHIPAARLHLVYNGIDVQEMASARAERQAARDELGLGPGDQAVISVGRLSQEKDYATLLRAMVALQGPRLFLVGHGPVRGELEKLAAELGLGERVAFLGERSDVPRLLAACDLFALSSLTEGISMALLEAMAGGLPVAATAVGGTPELVIPNETGMLVPPSDPATLAQAMGALLGDPERSRAYGLAGAQRVAQRFSLEAMAEAYAKLYRLSLG